MGYAVAIGTFLVARPVVTLLFGNEYRFSGDLLSLYIWSGIFVNVAMVKASWLNAMNLTRIQFISTLTGAVVNVLLNLVLIKHYGAMGAAWATIVSYAVEGYLILFLFPKARTQAVMITKALVMPVVRLNEIR
jgi:O-antigen/teichoic acid export membrane protein